MNRLGHDRTPPSARDDAGQRLCGLSQPDVLIIGGGVNGVGTLRDLALNGVSAVLVDAGDFCAGASGATTRMAHGGLRYLEGREFRLVAESVRERNLLLRHAPHMVRPLEVLVPLESLSSGLLRATGRFLGVSQSSGPLSLAALKCALMLYEWFGSMGRVLPRHRTIMRRQHFPKGLSSRIRAIVGYFDGQIASPETLVLEMLAEAQASSPGVAALNHTAWSVTANGTFELVDKTGDHGCWAVRPRLVVNAAGGWIDEVNSRLGLRTESIRGVKGAHLVIRNDRLRDRMSGRAFYFDDGFGRMVICVPTQDTVLIGTTEVETRCPDDRAVAPDEIDYLLTALSRLFTDIDVEREDVVAVTSGVRPLQSGGSASSTRAARDHVLAEAVLPGAPDVTVLSMIGGKWTTFRAFSEIVADRILEHLGRTRAVSTRERAYPGAVMPSARELAQSTGLDPARTATLLARYGGTGAEIAGHCAAGRDRPLADADGYSVREVEWLIRRRSVCMLEDLVLRRTQLVLSGRLTGATLRDLSAILAATLGRGTDWASAELARAEADPRILGLAPKIGMHAA